MKMAKACGATRLKIFGDSQLVAQQVMNQCDVVNDSMIAYKEVYNELEKLFDGCEVNHISRLSNDEADVLANIGSQCLPIPPGVFWEEIAERSTKPKKAQKKAKEEKTSAPLKEAVEDEEDQELVMMVEVPWMQAYISYILDVYGCFYSCRQCWASKSRGQGEEAESEGQRGDDTLGGAAQAWPPTLSSGPTGPSFATLGC
ncbi:hypothetical protein QYE76_003370 [Lolium multiflorum]|uniref:RNase H type-1 domain-containing protein n=1 Tax=Lolium multiflorum TaxID=4521 RepID=A0AAD8VYS2_LOLMU|nr:hypothetical protein QYE76_003370 [Lolium multiflorum]